MTERVHSELIKYLPVYYRSEESEDSISLVEGLLLVWEAILIKKSIGDTNESSLGQKLENVWGYCNAATSPIEYLEWLAEKVGLTLESDWNESKKRKIIAEMISVYRKRGTKSGLEKYLGIYFDADISISEEVGFRVGKQSAVGIDTMIGGAYYFIVTVNLRDVHTPYKTLKRISGLIDREKPLHTVYSIKMEVGTMRIGYFSTVGKDTLLGLRPVY